MKEGRGGEEGGSYEKMRVSKSNGRSREGGEERGNGIEYERGGEEGGVTRQNRVKEFRKRTRYERLEDKPDKIGLR